AARSSQLGGYRDSLLYTLRDLLGQSKGMFDYAEGNFLAKLFEKPRTFIFLTGDLSTTVSSLFASMCYLYAFESRRKSGISHPPVVHYFDDSMNLVTGTRTSEAEGRSCPIADWSMLGRSLGIGIVWAAQNFSLVSPMLLGNTDTIICLGNYGIDAGGVSRFMNLTPWQAEYVPRLGVGEGIAIARSQYPFALYGAVPEVV
ncbi:hypothetical protein ACFL34_05385, partial [Candidatus Sumerlaeota bacterium]